MKSVLMSIQPKWVEKIASGEKTIEVRKSKPKLEMPFKVYIYCTKNTPYNPVVDLHYKKDGKFLTFTTGKVIGEFVCDRIAGEGETIRGNACLTVEELQDYCNGKDIYFWHITDLKIYDKPKDLSEFEKPCNFKWECSICERYNRIYRMCDKAITRPPQSWCYVEN